MTPLEHAKNLINKMNNVDLDCKNESMCMLYPHAVQCALIAINEKLESLDKIKCVIDCIDLRDYYLEVKEEIIKISKTL